MVQSHRQRALSAAPGATRHNAALKKKSKAPYKVVFEQVTEKRRKLLTVLSFNAHAPAGYTFIPAGDPQITNRCKQVAREDGLKVYIVSTSKHKHPGILSHEVHRIGHHFPSLVVEKACMSLGVSLTQSGHVLSAQRNQQTTQHNLGPQENVTTNRLRWNAPWQEDVSQAILDTQAREAIKDLFPKIPEKDLHDIICRAFKKGKDRVGTAIELPLSRRVQLAVVAHIRHVYTDYDKLLKTGTYQNARAAVEKPCLDLLAQWRSDDDDDDPNAMEEILREVIVIDDDDDENKDRISPLENRKSINRDDSIEIISSHAFAEEVQTRHQLVHRDRPYNPEVEDNENIRYTDRERPNPTLDRSGIHRHRWQEALHRHRTNPVFTHQDKHERLVPRLELSTGRPKIYTETVAPQRQSEESRQNLPLHHADYPQSQNLPYFDLKDKNDLSQEAQWLPNSSRLTEVLSPAQERLQSSRDRREPIQTQQIWRKSNDYKQSDHPVKPRNTTSEEKTNYVRDGMLQRQFVDNAYNQEPRNILHQQTGHLRPSTHGKAFEENNFASTPALLKKRSSGYPNEFNKYDPGKEGDSRIIPSDNEIEAHNRRQRKGISAPTSSERFWHLHDDFYPERTILVPLAEDDGWREAHEQLSPPVKLSKVNPFIRRGPTVHVQREDAMKHADKHMLPHVLQYEASHASREPMREYGRANTFNPSSHLIHMPAGCVRQVQQDLSYSAFEPSGNVSLIPPSSHVDHMSGQSSHLPFNSTKISRHAYDHLAREYPQRGLIEPIEYQADVQKYEQIQQFDSARLGPGLRYHQDPFTPTYDGIENQRALVPSDWDHAQLPFRGEARTGIFLRKLQDEKHMLPKDARLRTSRSRLYGKVNNSPRSNADSLLPLHLETRDVRTRNPVREEGDVNLSQHMPELGNDQLYVPVAGELRRTNHMTYTSAHPGQDGRSYVEVPGWESRDPREIIVID